MHLQRREWQPERLCQALGRAIQRRVQTAGAQYEAGQLGGEVSLPAALVCLGSPQSRLTNKHVRKKCDRHEDDDRHQVLRPGRDEAAVGAQMEVHVDKRTGQRRHHCQPESPAGRDHQDAEQEQRTDSVPGRELIEPINQQGLDRN